MQRQSWISKIWDFMNKSPILSSVIISILAILWTQVIKIYTYIYWLPYFKTFSIPLIYFDIAILDKYTYIVEILPAVLFIFALFESLSYMEKKLKIALKLGRVKLLILISIIICGSTVMQSILVRKPEIPSFFRFDIWNYFDIVFWFEIIQYVFLYTKWKINIKVSPKFIAFCMLIFLVGTGTVVYIQGYNNAAGNLVCDLRMIEEDKVILFETVDQYYIVPCKELEDGSIKIYEHSYSFVDKNKQVVRRFFYNHVYDEFDRLLKVH